MGHCDSFRYTEIIKASKHFLFNQLEIKEAKKVVTYTADILVNVKFPIQFLHHV